MGRTRENKQAVIDGLKKQLDDTQLTVVIDYEGLSVAEISELRNCLRPSGTLCKVTKNTFMRLAVAEDENWQPMTEFLSGCSAFLLVKDDIGGAIRAYQKYAKTTKKTTFRGGVMQGQALTEVQVKAIADLPSKEELMAQIAGAINAIPTKLALGIKEVPSSLARSINEVPASVGRGIQAIANQSDDEAA